MRTRVQFLCHRCSHSQPFAAIHIHSRPSKILPRYCRPLQAHANSLPCLPAQCHQATKKRRRKNTKSVSRGAVKTLPPNGDERCFNLACLASRSCTVAPGRAAGFRMRASIVILFRKMHPQGRGGRNDGRPKGATASALGKYEAECALSCVGTAA